ncbi:MAG: DUF4926 domain-containing protein [Chthoniobacteraceae bacterium]|jgi:hypothetical protein
MTSAKVLDTVALLVDKPALGLSSGQMGTIVEMPVADVFEVEFRDTKGRTIGFAELRRADFLVLHHEPALAA